MNRGDQPLRFVRRLRRIPLRISRLTQHPTRPTFRHLLRSLYLLDRSASPRRAQKFPSTASFKINMSNA
jgi:hypothetical protein